MGKFLENEKIRLAEFKANSDYFTDSSRIDGIYKKKPYPFCLPKNVSEENLFAEIRYQSIDYFSHFGIKWHDGIGEKPSNHLCDSEVCCVNFLFPFIDKPDALIELLRPIFPSIKTVISMECPNTFVSFEWIGQKNYLNERMKGLQKRTRGANFTSTDAAVMFEKENGNKQIVLIEWKYTESYGATFLKISKNGTDRTMIYSPLYEKEDCPIDKSLLNAFNDLFYEPFYQLMRQQLLAHEMEKVQELGASVVSLLHISPRVNLDFKKVTSKELQSLGSSPIEIWEKLIKQSNRFYGINTETFFGQFPVSEFEELSSWWEYITKRYLWLT